MKVTNSNSPKTPSAPQATVSENMLTTHWLQTGAAGVNNHVSSCHPTRVAFQTQAEHGGEGRDTDNVEGRDRDRDRG